jgi:hypothetical protein
MKSLLYVDYLGRLPVASTGKYERKAAPMLAMLPLI